MPLSWSRQAERELWLATSGDFTAKVHPKGDGRWSWEVFKTEALAKGTGPVATGVARSFGAAKSVAEQLIARS